MGAFSAGNHLPLAVQVRGEEVSQRKYTNTDTKADTETNVRVQIQIQIHANNLLPLAAHVRGKEVSQGKKLNTRVASVSYFLPWEIFCSGFFICWSGFTSLVLDIWMVTLGNGEEGNSVQLAQRLNRVPGWSNWSMSSQRYKYKFAVSTRDGWYHGGGTYGCHRQLVHHGGNRLSRPWLVGEAGRWDKVKQGRCLPPVITCLSPQDSHPHHHPHLPPHICM